MKASTFNPDAIDNWKPAAVIRGLRVYGHRTLFEDDVVDRPDYWREILKWDLAFWLRENRKLSAVQNF